MADQQEFCLRWHDFHRNFHVSLDALRGDESFTDVTLSCSGKLLKAHRVILSACSSHFKQILKDIAPQQHPVVVLPTVDFAIMRAILEFIYQGQVNVRQTQLSAFLQVAETFSIQGLADDEAKKQPVKQASTPRTVPFPAVATTAASPSRPPSPRAAKRRRQDSAPPPPSAAPPGVAARQGRVENMDMNIKSESSADAALTSEELGILLEPVAVVGEMDHAADPTDVKGAHLLGLDHHDAGSTHSSAVDPPSRCHRLHNGRHRRRPPVIVQYIQGHYPPAGKAGTQPQPPPPPGFDPG